MEEEEEEEEEEDGVNWEGGGTMLVISAFCLLREPGLFSERCARSYNALITAILNFDIKQVTDIH